jgi:hypothetical protein
MWPFTQRKQDIQSRTCCLCDELTDEETNWDGFWIVHKACWPEFWKVLRANECTENIAEYAVLRAKETTCATSAKNHLRVMR